MSSLFYDTEIITILTQTSSLDLQKVMLKRNEQSEKMEKWNIKWV